VAVTTNLGPAAAPDDSALINLVLNGHSECFAVLMDRHAAMVKRRIRGMTRSFSDADDIMQEAVERLPAKDEQVVVLHDLQRTKSSGNSAGTANDDSGSQGASVSGEGRIVQNIAA